tara:strand:+ start:492 stop:713 length:222 start_codon:yes stop_codon:yes gene_type:complete
MSTEFCHDLAEKLYFKAIEGREKQFIIELEDGSTENNEKGSDLYWRIEDTVESMLKKAEQDITKEILSNLSTL